LPLLKFQPSYNRLPKEEPSGWKHVDDIKIKNYYRNLENVHFVGL